MNKLATASIFIILFLAGCSSSSNNDYTCSIQFTYEAFITSDEDETHVDVQRYLYPCDESETPTVETLPSFSLSYGVLKFTDNHGSVPGSQPGLPERCYQGQTLGLNDAMDCWANPILERMRSFTEENNLSAGDIMVNMQLPTNIDETRPEYPVEPVNQLMKKTDVLFDAAGFDSNIFYEEEPDAGNAVFALAGYNEGKGYNHKSTASSQNPDWMSRLQPKTKRLSELSLPGTHDSISLYWGDMAETQGLKLNDQLMAGIRVLDIRLRCDKDKELRGYHGSFDQYIYFSEILNTIREFLKKYSSETIYMRVSNEHKKDSGDDIQECAKGADWSYFYTAFAWYYSNYSAPFWKPNGETNPTLEQTQGKIVVLQNFKDPAMGRTHWGLDYTSTNSFDKQDNYEVKRRTRLHDKWISVKNALNSAKNKGPQPVLPIYVNYLSGAAYTAGDFIFPYFVASGKSSPQNGAPLLVSDSGLECINSTKKKYPEFWPVSCVYAAGCGKHHDDKKRCLTVYVGTNTMTWHWLNNNYTRYTGMVMVDFPGSDLIGAIIGVNFNQ